MVSRREFVERVSVGVVGALPLVAGACAKFHYVGSGLEQGRLVVSLAEFGAGPFALVDAPNLPMPIYLYQHADGSFTAVLTRCMHRGCQVEPTGGHLVCPCHGSEYDNMGGILKGPTQFPLIRFPVETQGGNLYIALTPVEEVQP
ncbi:MAG TPA: Rieske (2Fe-2S) protein [Gemmatimonadales bacterium]|jgi:cytochrome b6-f complex iron-sulfur subunit